MEPYSCEEITQAPSVEPYYIHNLLSSCYGIRKAEMEPLTGYEDCNFLLSNIAWQTNGPSRAILKVTNPLEAKLDDNIDFQMKICETLNGKGILCPKAIKRVDGRYWAFEEVVEGVHLPVRLFEVLPGSNLENFSFEPQLVEDIGELLAKFHVIADESKLSVAHVPYIAVEHRRGILLEAELLHQRSVLSKDKTQLVAECLAEFDDRIANSGQEQDIGLIHSDINETNILVSKEGGTAKITGLLDFGDVHRSFRIVDIASTVLYLHLSDKLNQGVEILAKNLLRGYRRVRPFPDCTHLLTAMKARLSCSLVYGLRTARINMRGGDTDYVLRTQSNGWKILQDLHNGSYHIR